MSFSDGDALRQAIIAQPDDDIARLVFADWLDETGQSARAAFVRAQVAAARAEPYSPDARRHARAAERVLERHRGEWAKHLGPCVLGSQFHRGFVEHAQVNVASFPRDAAALFAAEPIRSVGMTRFAGAAQTVSLLPFFDTPQLARVTRLDLTALLAAPNELEPLAECPHLAAVTDLVLRDTPVPLALIEQLLAGPRLPALSGLDVADLSNHGPSLARALPTCHRQLLRLNVSNIPFTSAELRTVLESRCLRDVEELRLGWMTRAGHEGALCHLNLSWGVIPWTRLKLLDLNGQGIGNGGVAEIVWALARVKGRAPLRWLGLANNKLGPDAVRALVESDPAKLHLYHLDVSGNGLSLAELDALHERFAEAAVQCRGA